MRNGGTVKLVSGAVEAVMISESIRNRRGISVGEVSYKGHRYSAEIIAHCVWLYHRFPLSFREVEELMLVRGVIVTYETHPAVVRQVRTRLRRPACAAATPDPATRGTSTRCS